MLNYSTIFGVKTPFVICVVMYLRMFLIISNFDLQEKFSQSNCKQLLPHTFKITEIIAFENVDNTLFLSKFLKPVIASYFFIINCVSLSLLLAFKIKRCNMIYRLNKTLWCFQSSQCQNNVTAVMNGQRTHSTLCELNNESLCDFIEDCSQPS